MNEMKTRYRLIFRGIRGGMFYCVDKLTGKRTSLQTADKDEAQQIVEAKNNSVRQPVLNLQIAKAYLAGSDNGVASRTWQQALESLTNTKRGANQHRWRTVAKDKALAPLLPRVIIETQGEVLLKALQVGTVSTNVFLRRLHNFCVDMNWLPWPLIPKRQWPAVKFKEKRGITLEEHQKIIAAEVNPERKALYQLCWHLGASQGDIAALKGEDVDWANGTVSFTRKKTSVPVLMRYFVKQHARLLDDHRQSRECYQKSLQGVVAEQSAMNAKLVVCLEANTKVLGQCRDELRRRSRRSVSQYKQRKKGCKA
jgi:integrase